ncbi:MAG: hypothetical protein FJX71_01155 [Alphaproteobacteria bacterium]|nr:hypothetical protein [Alphaproteobacteria bacterium]
MILLQDISMKAIVGGGSKLEQIGNSINYLDTKTGKITQNLYMATSSDAALQDDGVFDLEHVVPGLNK